AATRRIGRDRRAGAARSGLSVGHRVHFGGTVARRRAADDRGGRALCDASSDGPCVGAGHAGHEGAFDGAMSLRFRINLIMTVLVVLFSLVTAKIVVDDARRSIREEMEADTKVTLQLLSSVLYNSQFVAPNEDPSDMLQSFLHSLDHMHANE